MEKNRHLFSRVVFFSLFLHLVFGDCVNLDLGMERGTIPDNKITASTVLNASTPAKNSRLNYTAGSSWCSSTNDSNPYLQIDLQTLHIICAVSTQGNSQGDQWVETYTLQLSTDGTTWTDYEDDGQVKIFTANNDRNTGNKNIIYKVLLTRWLRFVGKTSYKNFCLRAEVFGVKKKPENLALKRPTAQSSTCCCGADRHAVDGITAQNHDNQGYCTHTNADNPSWWRVDLGSNPVPVFEVHIVNRFSNYPSVSSRNVDYKITVGHNQDVQANPECVGRYSFINYIASAVCYMNPLKTGRYVGIMTTEAQMLTLCEVEIYSRENLAYNKHTDQITTATQWRGDSSRAVDGNSDTRYEANSCSHTLNHHVNPWWRVDLGQEEPVTEVYVVNRDGINGERLNPFEIRVGSAFNNGGVTNPKCGDGNYRIPPGQGASFFCRPSLFGRYVTIRITKSEAVALTLCEVEVYSARRACQIQAVGLASSYAFPDSSFSASSSSAGNEAPKGRLTGPSAWLPSTDSNASDYLQIDLQHEFFICAVATQGNPNADHWTRKYKVHLSVNDKDWIAYQENNVDKIFDGNDKRRNIIKHNFERITSARFIRFQPTSFYTRKALRVEVYGVLRPTVPLRSPTNLTVTAISSTSITAMWQLPPVYSVNGIITGFKLYYEKKYAADSPTTMLHVNNATVLAKNVTGLDKFTEYEFKVLALSSDGDGPKSSVIVVRTKEDVPSQAPVSFTVNADTSTSITAGWQLPPADSRNGIITGFKLFYKEKGSADSPTIFTINNGTTLTETVIGLDKNTTYQFQVLAFTSVGDGPKSSVQTETTRVEPPSIVEDVSPPSVICEKQSLCVLSCLAISEYPVTYSWAKDGETLNSDDVKVMNNTFAVRPRDAKDYGLYVCNATNSFGSTAYTINLSEGTKSSSVAGMMKGDKIQKKLFNIYRYAVFGLSGTIVLLIIAIGLLARRKRRSSPEKQINPKMSTSGEEGEGDKPRDEYVSEPRPNIELHVSPPEEQSRTSLVDVTIPGINTDPVFDYVTLDREKEEKQCENSYEAPVEQQVSEPTSYIELHRSSQEELLHAYQSLKDETLDSGYCDPSFNRKKIGKSREDALQDEDQDSGYCDRSFNGEKIEKPGEDSLAVEGPSPGYYNRSSSRKKMEKPAKDTLPDADPAAGYYNRGINRKKIGKPEKDSLQEEDPAPGYYNRSIPRQKIEKPGPAYYNRSFNRDKIQGPVPGEDVYEIADSQA